MILLPGTRWRTQASCRGADNDEFVPESQPKGPPSIVTELCPSCPVRAECEQYGRSTGSSGWWGGMFLCWGFTAAEWKRLQTWARELVMDNEDPDRDVRAEIANGKPMVLTQTIVNELRQRYAQGGRTQLQLAQDYNLEHGTVRGVIKRQTWNHQRHVLQGEEHPKAVLTRDDVIEIKRRIATGEVHRLIAADFGVSRAAIADISCGRKWASVN